MTPPDCLLYLITPPSLTLEGFLPKLKEALDASDAKGGIVAALQLRLKGAADAEVVAVGKALLPLLRSRNVSLIVNDRADLAKAIGADGVHLGQDDGSIAEARKLLGAEANIGATCHDSRHLAMVASEEGADYVAFGAFYPTETKDTVHRPDPEILSIWSQMTLVPSVAIGGITPDNAAPLVAAGADYLAVSGGVWSREGGPGAAISAFAEVLKSG